MKKISIRYIVTLISLALLVLVSLQLYQAKQLYNQKSDAYSEKINNLVASIALKHERVSDIKTYAPIFGSEFKDQYKMALKEEFRNIFPVQETVSIIDTAIYENGVPNKYYYVTGKSYDSLSGVSASHSLLIKDLGEVNALVNNSISSRDSANLAYELDRKVKTQLITKAKFVNQKMVDVFRNVTNLSPQQRIDLSYLDSIINQVFKENKISTAFDYAIFNTKNEVVTFPAYTHHYNESLSSSEVTMAKLFPSNIFEDALFIGIHFTQKKAELFGEMWFTLLVSFLLIVLIVVSFFVMFRTIINQRRLSVIKNDFINNMTHEFKTPISTISLACEALGDKDMLKEAPPEMSPFVNMINQENKRLSNLVERILQSAVIDRGELNLKKEKLELNQIVKSVIDNARLRVASKSGEIELNLSTSSLFFTGDSMHTQNIISNLVDNAIKYCKNIPKIKVVTFKEGEAIVLQVIDNGIGIKSEHLDKIFQKLYRVPTGNLHDVKGFGLGLSYVKAITDIEGWTVSVNSKFGEGSTFSIRIIKSEKYE
ncbi:MAG: sensor histidine kinase [Lishizhenia sp.]